MCAEAMGRSQTIVEGEFEIGTQYHFYMETHVTACVPTEDGMDVYCSTQDGDAVQGIIAGCLNLKKSQLVFAVIDI
jgi:xanthine dehydrogenase molybdopterin-binding subunit B